MCTEKIWKEINPTLRNFILSKVSDSNDIEDIIEIKVSENYCKSCSELINSEAYCRTITYDGNEYEDISAKAIRHAAYKRLGLNQSEANSHSSTSCDCGQNGCC